MPVLSGPGADRGLLHSCAIGETSRDQDGWVCLARWRGSRRFLFSFLRAAQPNFIRPSHRLHPNHHRHRQSRHPLHRLWHHPAPTPARMPLPQQRFSVPENTRDPVLVERGVKEWLDQQPEYPIYQKVAILHRMRQESSFNPCAMNGPMRYLLQWRDDRLRRLYQATGSGPGTCPSWLAQMQFMDSEIRSNSRYAQFF